MQLSSRSRFTVLVALIATMVFPAAATAQDLEEVERQVDQLTDEVTAVTEEFEQVRAQVEAAEDELADLQGRAGELEAAAAAADEDLGERIRAMFKYGQDPVLASLMSASGPQDVIDRASLMSALTERDRATFETASNLRTELDQTRALVTSKADELADLESQLAARRDDAISRLEATEQQAKSLREVAERQRQISNGVQQGTYACIHDANTFVDSWGAPRSGGRSHKGVDVLAPYDVPVYAFTNGTISRMKQGGIAGINLYLQGDDGNEYFYAHLSGYADVAVGARVQAGQLIGYNGDTGNARGTPHVHFELHPGGSGAINPYPFMAAACL